MVGSRFDTLARAVAPAGTRRRLMALLAVLPLGGGLAIADDAVAERPLDRVQRHTTRRNRQQRNNTKHQNQNNRNQNPILSACEELYQPCIDSLLGLHVDGGSTCCFILADCDVARYNKCLVAIGFGCPPPERRANSTSAAGISPAATDPSLT